jgi:hypothetical protein
MLFHHNFSRRRILPLGQHASIPKPIIPIFQNSYPLLSKPTASPLPAGGQGLSKSEGGRNLAIDNLKYPLFHHSITPEA